MKNIFCCFKKKWILAGVAGVMMVPLVAGLFVTTKASSPKPEYTIVIDAGHGGRDGGAIGGESGVTESELNLAYALELKEICEQYGMGVVLTRKDMNGLYDEDAPNKKKSEMQKRIEIINNSNADLMISLHMNSFPLPSSEGAHVFYAKGSDEGFELAKSIQLSVCKSFENARDYVTVGDYFVLNYSNVPAVLIECGFLSNPEEEKNLQSAEYRKNFCYSMLAGVLSYFKM